MLALDSHFASASTTDTPGTNPDLVSAQTCAHSEPAPSASELRVPTQWIEPGIAWQMHRCDDFCAAALTGGGRGAVDVLVVVAVTYAQETAVALHTVPASTRAR